MQKKTCLMKAILTAAILFPVTFLIISWLFEDSSSSIKRDISVGSILEYELECQYNEVEEPKHFEVCPVQTNQIE